MKDKYCRFEPFYTNKVKHLTPKEYGMSIQGKRRKKKRK